MCVCVCVCVCVFIYLINILSVCIPIIFELEYILNFSVIPFSHVNCFKSSISFN